MIRVGLLMCAVIVALAAACAAPVQQKAETETAAPATATEETAPSIAASAGAIWPPRMPSAGNFEAVPLGKWADYQESYLDAATIKERVALVSKGSEAITIETTTETRPGDKTVFATVFGATREAAGWRVTSNVFQVADDDPMEAPASGPAQQPYPPADPKKFVGTEMVSVRAGLFKAKHYRYRTPYGEQVDFWIDDSVAPIGLVKLEAEQKQHAAFRGGFKFELIEMGSGAIPQVTRAARPFDAGVLQRQGLPWTRHARVGPQPPVKVIQ